MKNFKIILALVLIITAIFSLNFRSEVVISDSDEPTIDVLDEVDDSTIDPEKFKDGVKPGLEDALLEKGAGNYDIEIR